MITIRTTQQFPFSRFCAAMREQYPDWKRPRQVQIAQKLQRAGDGNWFIEVRLNPLAGYQMPVGVKEVAESLLAKLAGDVIPVPVVVHLPRQPRSRAQRAADRLHF